MPVQQPLPRMFKAEEIVPTTKHILSQFKAVQDEIVRTVTPSTATFENVMLPLAEVDNATTGDLGVIWMLQYAAPDMETQDAVAQARKLYSEAEASWTARDDFYELLCAAQANTKELDDESKLLLSETLLDYRRCGRGRLDKSETERYMAETLEIEGLCTEFQRNVSQEKGGLYFTEEELDGVPIEEMKRWADDEPDSLGTKRKFVPFANGGTAAITTYAHRAETRKRMFVGNQTKLAVNVPLLHEIAKKRQLQASMLGYQSHAAFRIERRMVKTTDWVESFLKDLLKGLAPLGRKELQILQNRRLEAIKDNDRLATAYTKQIPPWDLGYYQNLVEKEAKVDHAAVSEFFPLEHTAAAMLGVFSSFLNLRFELLPKDKLSAKLLWHDTVQVYSVWDGMDKDAEFLGYLYFDLLWRENKYRGNQNVTMECSFLRPDGTRHCPSTILMCAFPTTTPTKCALLKHHEVVTLFHELGHGIHNLVSKTTYARFHGTRLPPDFGEMPSVMLENWCWMPDVLQALSCHYSTLKPEYLMQWREEHPGAADPPQKIPYDLVHRLTSRRYANRALYHLFQLSTSLFDLGIHSPKTPEEAKGLDLRKVWFDLREEVEGLDFSVCRENGSHLVSFTHLTAGYDAGYYSYLCCTAIAQDMFQEVFAREPGNREAWAKYRREILRPGGSHPDMLGMLQAFIGHSSNSNALVEALAEFHASQ